MATQIVGQNLVISIGDPLELLHVELQWWEGDDFDRVQVPWAHMHGFSLSQVPDIVIFKNIT